MLKLNKQGDLEVESCKRVGGTYDQPVYELRLRYGLKRRSGRTTMSDHTIPAYGSGPLDTPFRRCVVCDQLKTELATLKERLAGLSAEWRNTHDAMTCAKAAADLDAVLKENNDEPRSVQEFVRSDDATKERVGEQIAKAAFARQENNDE